MQDQGHIGVKNSIVRARAIHAQSEEYDLESFIAGNNSLHKEELDILGNVKGKSLLHLQCHFGLDTISWERLGAKATGVDFNETAIELAREITKRIGVATARAN